jgi:hypothetical protein
LIERRRVVEESVHDLREKNSGDWTATPWPMPAKVTWWEWERFWRRAPLTSAA